LGCAGDAIAQFLRPVLALLLLAWLIVPSAGICQTYTTTFDGAENPLSEGGKWSNNGLDWTNIRKGQGIVYINGVKKAQAVDDTFKTGNPGIGQFLACSNGRGTGTNADFGFRRFTAKAIEKTTGATPAYPLKVSANRRYLVDRNNVPFLIAGDSPQALVSNLSEEQADSYFANRQAHGFNSAGWMNVVSATPCYPASHNDASTFDGIRPFTAYIRGGADYAHYDITKPNAAYFARLDRMIRLAEKHGIVVFLDPMETINWLPTLRNNGLAACAAYGKYLGSRYKDFPNIVWLHGNDFSSWKNGPGDGGLVQAVAKGIKSEDPGHLQTVELMLDPSTQDPTWRPIISLNLAYTYAATYAQMLECYNAAPALPAFLGEAHYDLEQVGSPTDFGTPSVLRRQAYWTMLCGGTGQFYGNAFTWTFKPGWEKNLDTPGAAQFTHWKNFFARLPWHDLRPDQAHAVVTAGLGKRGDQSTRVSQSDYLTAAATPGGALVIAYMPTVRMITVNMASLKSPAAAKWFDPTNGAYIPVAAAPLTNSGSRQFTPPGKNHDGDGDWVLLLEASVSR
jgi:hypothetical protein